MLTKEKNLFKISELSGAVGDLGTLLPLAFALVVFVDFPHQRLFLLWGLAYVLSGWFFKLPVAVQPLKAMAAIAIASGLSINLISTAAFLYGLILIVLSLSGLLRWLERWFSQPIIRGIQAGVGFILVQKALSLLFEHNLFLSSTLPSPILNTGLFFCAAAILWLFQFRKHFPVIILIIIAGMVIALVSGVSFNRHVSAGPLVSLNVPHLNLFLNSLLLLIIPQLPLTLGNAIFSASDLCHTLWKDHSQRVSPTRLGYSIGISNVVIGLLGGFPICHGSGGIAAHAQFGGKTGATTMIIGAILITIALVPPLSGILFYIPIPILGALLFFAGLKMVLLIKKLDSKPGLIVAAGIALLALLTRNFFLAMVSGFILEYILLVINRIKMRWLRKT